MPGTSTSVEDWLRGLSRERSVSAAIHAVIQAIIADPETASYATVSGLAAAARVDGATVTRTARAVGFDGWPRFREEVRARYLGGLSLPAVASVRAAHATGLPFDSAINAHLANLADIRRRTDRRAVIALATAMASAERCLIFASGSFTGLARILTHNLSLAGLRAEAFEDPVRAGMALATLQPTDLVMCLSFWRLFRSTSLAAQRAKAKGATVCVITDQGSSPLAAAADHLLLVSTEGVSVFASLVPSLALLDALVAELAALEPRQVQDSIAAIEAEWETLDVFANAGVERGPAQDASRPGAPELRSPRRRSRKRPAAPP